ncbi:DNA-binding transcriptional LysR family regulator [Variovorax sp. TBS-050B]|nr:DNA-binding transcriptional LysR family regulator [Variovorax sp. TBS-050B]
MLDVLTLSQMQMFVAVADAGSFRAGAARLHRVQSAVSHAIATLEAQLQVQLFDRSGHKPVLTATGTALLGDVRVILSKVEALRARAQGIGQGIELGLALAVDTLVPPALVAGAIRQMHAVYPSIAMRVAYSSMGGTIDALNSGRCDLAIAAFGHADEKIGREFLMPLHTVAVAAPAHALALRAAERGARGLDAAAAEHVQIVVEDPSTLSQGYDIDVLSPATWRVTDMYIKLELLRAGLGWGKMPAWLVADDLAAGRLVQLPMARIGRGGRSEQPSYFCHRADKTLGAGAALLRDCLMAQAKSAAFAAGGASASPRTRRSPRSAAPAPRPAARPPRAARGR